MIDFWEVIGRMAAGDALFDDLAGAYQGTPLKQISACAYAIQQVDYRKVQSLVSARRCTPCLSLMAAGELILGFTSAPFVQAFRALIGQVQKAVPPTLNPSPNFYITLGIIVLDNLIRVQLANSPASGVIPALPLLNSTEENYLRSLAQTTDFDDCATAVCTTRWDPACHCRLCFWPGHLHSCAQFQAGATN
jgi:hypothetical protein